MAVYQFELNDDANNALADITNVSWNKKLSARLKPPVMTASCRVPLAGYMADLTNISTILEPDAGDGFPTLHAGPNRRLKIRRDGAIVGNLFCARVDRHGDANQAWAEAFFVDPTILWQRRTVRDAGGSIVQDDGTIGFPTPASGPDLLKQFLDNSLAYDGSVFLDTFDGTWDANIPPAVDLSFVLENWPQTIGDMASRLIATGACDVTIAPVDTGAGYGSDIMGVVSAQTQAGSDLSGLVSFDYATGGFTAKAIRHSYDMSELVTALNYLLGPKAKTPSGAESLTRWRGSIDRTWSGVTTDPDPYIALYGRWVEYRIFESGETDFNAQRPLFTELWNLEQKLRMRPREMVYITPSPAAAPAGTTPPLPFVDYNIGDIVSVNLDKLGLTLLSGEQRIYGFDVDVGSEGQEQPGEIIASADAA